MGFLSLEVARKSELVASGLLALCACVLHHGSPNASALACGIDGDVFDNAGFSAALGEIVHDEQLVRADHSPIDERDEDAERGIAAKDGEMLARFFEREVCIAADAGKGVDIEDRGQIILCGLTDRDVGRHFCSIVEDQPS